jgi:hypothetical protein
MKIFLFICILFLFIDSGMGQNDNVKNNVSQKDSIETVDFCELITNPDSYKGKTVRTIAIYAYGGEDFTVLYCPQCYTKGILRPYFTDLFETKTKPKIASKLSRQKQSSGTVKVILVGIFHAHSFAIDYIETATYISKEYNFPDKLSTKTKRKVKCEEKD